MLPRIFGQRSIGAPLPPNRREHWERVLRWHARVTTIGAGIPFGMTRADAVDTVLAFFTVCYHLSDALVQSKARTAKEVEQFIRSSDALSDVRAEYL